GQDQKGLFSQLATFKAYFEQSKAEMRKVTWPTLKETKTTSIVVLAFVAVMVVFLGLVDLGFSKLIALILSA
ncbi:MAG: preprotein translocase subunit SecE, partial [Deltaproteobacteria bacterium]|nr:preprotein translocase subunit SecE [Deltaproteobacteria bacterium]